jgi:hypothetical protein
MKKSLMLGIIGVGAVASTALGQGIQTGNYTGDSGLIGAPITFAGSGLTIGSEFTAELLYSIGNSAYAVVPGSIVPFYGTDGGSGDGSGYSAGTAVLIPGWTSGAVSLEWTASGVAAGLLYTGTSAPFTMTPVASNSPDYPDFSTATGYSSFVVTPVPEPTTLALAGLGGLASLVAFRRKNA